ncbi:hypothetical protein QMO56_13875 [Roseomonas sp. E05]|uniref:hypothetical protein n=1 Tax=Roseomonas sp. E05 TaxID=3046310 RepID=UPI0024B87976|nr:hypothetical protein [Roseomonas sp. E05]MDJ0389205.1 hypothetical protein [Roseomonas sp. E05]
MEQDVYREPSAELSAALAAAAARNAPEAIEYVAYWIADHARMAIEGSVELLPQDLALTAGVLLAIAQEMRNSRVAPLRLVASR